MLMYITKHPARRIRPTPRICPTPTPFCRHPLSQSPERQILKPLLGWLYLSNATCLMRPHLFYACFVAPRITITCYMIRHL